MTTEEMIEALACASADAEVYGQNVEAEISRMWRAAERGDANALEDAYSSAKYEAFHFYAMMLAVKDVMLRFERRNRTEDQS